LRLRSFWLLVSVVVVAVVAVVVAVVVVFVVAAATVVVVIWHLPGCAVGCFLLCASVCVDSPLAFTRAATAALSSQDVLYLINPNRTFASVNLDALQARTNARTQARARTHTCERTLQRVLH
jgi:hypothetical protein